MSAIVRLPSPHRWRAALVAAGLAMVIGAPLTARAAEWEHQGWRGHEWREHQRHEWREHARPYGYSYGYYSGPTYYYGPTYAPSYGYGYAYPGPSLSFSFRD